MPTKIKKLCKHTYCNKIIDDGAWCNEHQPIRDSRYAKKDYSKWYSTTTWKSARLAYLAENPFCVHCQQDGLISKADVIDHIQPHKGDRRLFWDFDNWQALCKRCHDSKTATEDGGFGNRGRGSQNV